MFLLELSVMAFRSAVKVFLLMLIPMNLGGQEYWWGEDVHKYATFYHQSLPI